MNPELDDSSVLALVALANEYLTLQCRLELDLKQGRAFAALSRIDRSMVGVALYYVPSEVTASVTALAHSSVLRQERVVSSSSLRHRSHAAPDLRLGETRGGCSTSASPDPILWLGPRASPLASKAQAHFRSAVDTAVKLAAVRSALCDLTKLTFVDC
jgi:hypothetical protein